MENSFEEVNRARCFNHTLQLSAKTLLKPFNAGMSSTKPALEKEELDNIGEEISLDNDTGGSNENGDEDGDEGERDGGDEYPDDEGEPEDANNDETDELTQLDEHERKNILMDTAVVRQTVTKVRSDPS
jgi:hypothetical protein